MFGRHLVSEDPAYPPFAEACERFTAFARDVQPAEQIVFVRPSDVILWGGHAYVRPRAQVTARKEAERVYAAAVARRIGVMLHGVLRMDGCLCAHVSSPGNGLDAELRMYPHGLKLSLAHPMREATRVGQIWWLALRVGEAILGTGRHKPFLFT